jgi:hypothetical protein
MSSGSVCRDVSVSRESAVFANGVIPMKATVARLGQPTAANDLWKPVSANELAQIEGGLFGISWDDVKRAAKYVASQILKRL